MSAYSNIMTYNPSMGKFCAYCDFYLAINFTFATAFIYLQLYRKKF